MAGLVGFVLSAALFADPASASISADLDTYADDFAPYSPPAPAQLVAPRLAVAPAAPSKVRSGRALATFFDDFYNRMHVAPAAINLANLVTVQQRQVYAWNAFTAQSVALEATPLAGGEGIDIVAPGALPLEFAPLQEQVWQVSIGVDGPPTIDATWTFEFTGLVDRSVLITGSRVTPWPILPDWRDGITERLAWLTDLQGSPTGAERARALRLSPARTFTAPMLVTETERAYADMLVFGWSQYAFALPVWPDVAWLTAALPLASTSVPCGTAGRDFVAGGLAMLRAADPAAVRKFEVVEIDAITADALTLVRPTAQAWPAGTRLYPVRLARLQQAPRRRSLTERVDRFEVEFGLVEASDWPAAWPGATYRGYPVILAEPDRGDRDLTAQWEQLQEILEHAPGFPLVTTTSAVPYALQDHATLLDGRTAQATFRSLLYALQGRYRRAWLPTFAADLQLVAPIASGSVVLDVASIDYHRFGLNRVGRKDICLELADGTRLLRRITGAVALDADTERLQVDVAIGVDVAVAAVRRFSFMALRRLAADVVEWRHLTDADGVARVNLLFRSVRDDL